MQHLVTFFHPWFYHTLFQEYALWYASAYHSLCHIQVVKAVAKQILTMYSLIAFDERVTFWLQRIRSLLCACAYVALFARRLGYNHYAIAHAYNAANAHAQGSDRARCSQKVTLSLVEGNRSIDVRILSTVFKHSPWKIFWWEIGKRGIDHCDVAQITHLWITTQQHCYYSISHLLGTVTTQWRCSHCWQLQAARWLHSWSTV